MKIPNRAGLKSNSQRLGFEST